MRPARENYDGSSGNNRHRWINEIDIPVSMAKYGDITVTFNASATVSVWIIAIMESICSGFVTKVNASVGIDDGFHALRVSEYEDK